MIRRGGIGAANGVIVEVLYLDLFKSFLGLFLMKSKDGHSFNPSFKSKFQ